MRVFSVEMLVKEEGAAVVEAALKRLKGETAAVAAQMKVATSQVTSTGQAMREAGTGTQIAGDRAAKAAIGFAAVGQSIARTGSLTADAGTRIIEAGSQIATMFGPGGLVVAALLSAGVAIALRMRQTRDEIEKTKKSFDELADVGNVAGLKKELAELTIGRPSQNYQDGIIALSTELAKLKDKYQGVIFGLDGLTAASAVQLSMNAELSRQEKADLIRIGELNSKIAEKNELVQRLNQLMPIATSVEDANTAAVSAAEAAQKRHNDELERAAALEADRASRRMMGGVSVPLTASVETFDFTRVRERLMQPVKLPVERMTKDFTEQTKQLTTAAGYVLAQSAEQMRQLTSQYQMEIATMLTDGIAGGIADGLTAGFQAVFAGGGIAAGFQALTASLLGGLGSMLIAFGTKALLASTLMASLKASFAAFDPAGSAAKAIGIIALGAMLKGAAQAAFGGKPGSGGVGGGGGYGGTFAGAGMSAMQTQQIIFGATSATTAAGMTPRSATNVTIIGPNDPSAQRAMQELLTKANSRGSLGLMAYLTFNDGTAATLDNGTTAMSGGLGSRFADWTPFQRPVGAAAVSLGTGARSMFTFRTDYGASFTMNDIPNTSMSVMLRCQAHLLGGGTIAVYTEDTGARSYATCCLAPDADVTITLQDKTALLYSMSFTLINIAGSPSAMLCLYD